MPGEVSSKTAREGEILISFLSVQKGFRAMSPRRAKALRRRKEMSKALLPRSLLLRRRNWKTQAVAPAARRSRISQ